MMGETRVSDELLLIASGTLRASVLWVWVRDMVKCGGEVEERGTQEGPIAFDPLLLYSSGTVLGTAQSSHTNIWGKAATRRYVGPFPYMSVNTTRSVPEAVKAIAPVWSGWGGRLHSW